MGGKDLGSLTPALKSVLCTLFLFQLVHGALPQLQGTAGHSGRNAVVPQLRGDTSVHTHPRAGNYKGSGR